MHDTPLVKRILQGGDGAVETNNFLRNGLKQTTLI